MLASDEFLINYLPILLFFGIALGLGIFVTLIPFALGARKANAAKTSSYECGFDGIGEARGKFDIGFYLISILFIIFDLEVAFLFPWALELRNLNPTGFWSMMIFLAIVTIGFIYEWKKGALEWH